MRGAKKDGRTMFSREAQIAIGDEFCRGKIRAACRLPRVGFRSPSGIMYAGNRPIEVTRPTITDVGRRALAGV
jgi:hypothetical protein